jgi:Heterokaryon incompatibility protein (HET)
MRGFFENACAVLAWLGPEGDNSSHALRTLEFLASQLDVDWVAPSMTISSTAGPETHWADPKQPLPYDDVTWDVIQQLLLRPWCERLWIWQEVRLNSQNVVLMCGTSSISWQKFRSTIFCLRLKPEMPHRTRLRSRVDHVFELCDTADYARLEKLVKAMKYCNCSDPRDRVYAVLSLVGDLKRTSVSSRTTQSLSGRCIRTLCCSLSTRGRVLLS